MNVPIDILLWVGVAIFLVGFIGRMVARYRYLHSTLRKKSQGEDGETLATESRKGLWIFLGVQLLGLMITVIAIGLL